MPNKITILTITKSTKLRTVVRNILTKSSLLKMSGEVQNIAAAMSLAAGKTYDVILLDTTDLKSAEKLSLPRLLAIKPTPITLLVDKSRQGLTLGFEAMAHGAVDYIFKEDISINKGKDLTDKILAASRLEINLIDLPTRKTKAPATKTQKTIQKIIFCEDCGARNIFEVDENGENEERHCSQCGDLLETHLINEYKRTNYITIIAAGAGSYANLLKIIPRVSSGLGGSIIIALSDKIPHVDAFTKYLASISDIKVRRLINGISIEGGHCYVAAAVEGFFMKPFSTRNTMEGIGEVPGQSPVDLLMDSTAAVFKNNTVGLFLSGLELTGEKGLSEISRHGGIAAVLFSANCIHRQMGEYILRRCKVDKIVDENDATKFITELHDTVHDSKFVA